MRRFPVASSVALLAAALPAQSADGPIAVPGARYLELERAAIQLKTYGRGAEAGRLVEFMQALGRDEKKLARLRQRVGRARARRGDTHRLLARTRKNLVKTTATLADLLETVEGEERLRFARLLLGIDGDEPRSRKALDHEMVHGRWCDAATRKGLAHQAKVQAALQAARKLNPEITERASGNELLRKLYGKDGLHLSWHGVHMHTCWPEAAARRLFKNVIRACAFSNWLLRGKLQPPTRARHVNVLLDTRVDYEKAVKHDVASNKTRIREESVLRGLAGYYRLDRVLVHHRTMENHALAGLFAHVAGAIRDSLDGRPQQPCLVAGHANWVLMAFSGAKLPGILVREKGPAQGRTVAQQQREEARLLAGAGLMGVRSWMRYLAERGQDPPWARSFKDKVGKIDGEDLLKCTVVIEFLQERGQLSGLLGATRGAIGKKPGEVLKAMEKGLGQRLDEFEKTWRAWLCKTDEAPSLVERLGQAAEGKVNRPGHRALTELHRLRSAALHDRWLADVPTVRLDEQLSRGARLHALYLEKHTDQSQKWPDAHEEYTDREGFTPEGAWAGNHSVIAFVRTEKDAIAGWMGTFYHRLPLIEPGLLRVGWGKVGATAVLDTGSMVRTMRWDWHVQWPFPDMRSVPRDFRPELPNPVPGEDQRAWGYPITLQLGPRDDHGVPPVVEMTLRKGSSDGPTVECHYSTPQEPTNPLLVPENAYCLIPKRRLQPNKAYHVTAKIAGEDKVLVWSFRTGG